MRRQSFNMRHTLSTCVARSHAVGIHFFEVSACIAIRSERFYGVQLESLSHSVGSCQTEAMTRASSSDKIIRLKCKPGCKWNFLGWKTFATDADNNLDDLHGVRQYLRAPSYSYYNDRLCSDTDTKEKERKTKHYIFFFLFSFLAFLPSIVLVSCVCYIKADTETAAWVRTQHHCGPMHFLIMIFFLMLITAAGTVGIWLVLPHSKRTSYNRYTCIKRLIRKKLSITGWKNIFVFLIFQK